MRALFIGDSTTAGFLSGTSYSPTGGWPGELLRRLWPDHHIDPIGPSSIATCPDPVPFWSVTTFAAGLAAMDTVFAGLGDPPDLILVMVGIHDGIAAGWTLPSPPTTTANGITPFLTALASHAPAARIVVSKIVQPSASNPSGSTWAAYFNKYLSRACNAARGSGVNVRMVDAVTGFDAEQAPGTAQPDGLHLAEKGYTNVGVNWYRALTTPPSTLVDI